MGRPVRMLVFVCPSIAIVSSIPPLALCAPPWAAIDGITSTIPTSDMYSYDYGLAIADLEGSSHAEDSVVCFLGGKALDGQ
jgi:hypothetical protein